jgi:hypothetical protein
MPTAMASVRFSAAIVAEGKVCAGQGFRLPPGDLTGFDVDTSRLPP